MNLPSGASPVAGRSHRGAAGIPGPGGAPRSGWAARPWRHRPLHVGETFATRSILPSIHADRAEERSARRAGRLVLTVLLIAPIAAGLLLLAPAGRSARRSFFVATVPPARRPSAGRVAQTVRRARRLRCPPAHVEWVPELGLVARLPPRRLLPPDGAAGQPASASLVQLYATQYFPADHERAAPPRRPAGGLHRRPCSGSSLGQPARAVRGLGAHVGHVVPAHRLDRRRPEGPDRGAAGPAHHRAGGLAMLGGFVLIGQAAGTVRPRGARRRPAERHHGRGRPRARPPRRLHQVGPVPVLGLAPRRHGRAHPGAAPTCTRPRW